MKRFVFTLQKLYNVKKTQQDQKQMQLKDLERNLNNYQMQRKANKDLFDRQHAIYEEKCKKGMRMQEVKQYGAHFQYLEKEMRRQDKVIASCMTSIEECRRALVKLINEENVLDKMRDEQYREYLKEVQKNDDKMIEDFMQARM